MWIGVPKDASLCLRCRLRISRSLLPLAPSRLRQCRQNSRRQSTAAAVVEDPGENVEEPRNENRPSKKAKKPLRRSWKPPQVTELGVSSLGKPAEVLVLRDRDRHVPAVAKDEAERSRASQPQILEALQAENLPLSSESVKQSLDQIGDSYRNQSRALSTKDRTELRKKLMHGFTQNQLRSYCMEGDRPNLVAPHATRANNNGVQTKIASTSLQAGAARKDEVAATVGLKPGKAGLAGYIMHHKWALASFWEEQISQHVPIALQKLEYMLSYKPSLLKEYAKEFNVEVDASKEGGSITIKGKLKQVRAAQSAILHFLKGVEVSRVRSVTKGEYLERFATTLFLNHVTRTYNVMIDWASKHDGNISRQGDWLTICFHKTRDLQNALNAERAILLHERRLLPVIEERLHLQKVSMWLPATRVEPDFILHQPPQDSNVPDRQKAWARWMIPRKPTRMGSSGQGPDTSPSEMNKTVNTQIEILCKFVKGVNDEFFHLMPMKNQSVIRRLIDAGQVKEEIFVHVGQILFPNRDITIADAFYHTDKLSKTQLLTAKEQSSTLLSADLPGIPNALRSLSPWNEIDDADHGTEDKRHKRNYRLTYVPLNSDLPHQMAAPTIEIDILRNAKPGLAVTNDVTGAWAILDRHFHKILSPLLSSDLEFVRRLKRSFFQKPEEKADLANETTWLKSFGEQFQKLESDDFPPFLQVDLPEYTARYVYSESHYTQHGLDYQGAETQDASGSIASKLPNIKNIEASPAMPSAPKNITYMLECWELVNSTSYKVKNLCVEHLNLEGVTADENRALLRLAPQPLLDGNIKQTIIPKLLELAFKLAAHISHPLLLVQPAELSLSAIKTQHEELVTLGNNTQQPGEKETSDGKGDAIKKAEEKAGDPEKNSPELSPHKVVPPKAVTAKAVPQKAAGQKQPLRNSPSKKQIIRR